VHVSVLGLCVWVWVFYVGECGGTFLLFLLCDNHPRSNSIRLLPPRNTLIGITKGRWRGRILPSPDSPASI